MRKKIKLGFFTWEVFFQPDVEDHGQTDFDRKRILIDSDLSTEGQKETLFHEILHASMEDCAAIKLEYDKKEDREEDVIRHISPLLMLYITSNKWLREFIFGDTDV